MVELQVRANPLQAPAEKTVLAVKVEQINLRHF
jgi:hypothetical protein